MVARSYARAFRPAIAFLGCTGWAGCTDGLGRLRRLPTPASSRTGGHRTASTTGAPPWPRAFGERMCGGARPAGCIRDGSPICRGIMETLAAAQNASIALSCDRQDGGKAAPFLPMSRAEMDALGWDALRHRAGDGRRLCRPPELRHGDHRPAARGPGLPRRHHRAARLAVGGAVQGAGQAQAVLWRHRRQSRLDGQPLHGGPPAAQRRRLHGRRRGRRAAGPLHHRLYAALPRGVQGRADRARRHRGLAAPHRPLRLLVRQRCAARSSPTPRATC